MGAFREGGGGRAFAAVSLAPAGFMGGGLEGGVRGALGLGGGGLFGALPLWGTAVGFVLVGVYAGGLIGAVVMGANLGGGAEGLMPAPEPLD